MPTRSPALIFWPPSSVSWVAVRWKETTGVAPSFAIEAFKDVEEDVRQSIRRVRSSPFLPHRDAVRGFVYDVDTHQLREVEVAEESAA